MAAQNLAMDSFWIDGSKYSEAEKTFYERLGHEALTPLAAEFAKARERIREMKRQVDEAASVGDCLNIGLPIEQETTNIVVEPNQVTESCKQQSSQTMEQIVPTSTNITQTEDLPLEKSKAVEKSSELKDAVADKIDLPIIVETPKDKVLNLDEVFEKPVEEISCRKENVVAIPPEKEATSLQTPVLSDLVCDKQETPIMPCQMASFDAGAVKFLEKKVKSFNDVLEKVQQQLAAMDLRLSSIEKSIGKVPTSAPYIAICPAKPSAACAKPPPAEPAPKKTDEEDDDVDLFGSDSEDDEEANKVKEARLAEYNAKKSKKPALVAKSSIILDVKPWDDETDMKAMEVEVRKIACDGLLWGASKLVPLAYGIRKLQINCVVEDDKVSIDWLQEQIEANEDFVQSVDIAAFNKI